MKDTSEEIKKSTRILIIDDEAPIRTVLSESLKDEGFQVMTAHNGESGLKMIGDYDPHLVFLDIWMPGKMDGMDVLELGKQKFPNVDFVMISGHGNIETAVKATKIGAWDFIEKPLSMDKIFITITNAINYRQEKLEKSLLLNKLRESIAIIGDSSGLVMAKQTISKLAPTEDSVLISGEEGAGKQLIAKNIHYMSSRAGHSFASINCLQIPEDLLEGEIFGFERGSLPGIDKIKKGKLELVDGGTLFIAEISEMSLNCQSKLLQYLEDRKFNRFGGFDKVKSDVRVIASTSRNIEVLVSRNLFRQDLYNRINIMPLKLPPLKERGGDIPALVHFFSDFIAREGGYAVKIFSERAMNAFKDYSWPGNVRELKNFIERVYILTPSDYVDLHDVRFAGLAEDFNGSTELSSSGLSTFREARAKFEKEYLLKKIAENEGNISKTAEAIGLERSYLHRKIKAYGIEVN